MLRYRFSCGRLLSVTLPTSVKDIRKSAFQLTGISKVEIPDGVTHLGGAAFANCNSLKTVVIGKKVSQLDQAVFYNSSAITLVSAKPKTPPALAAYIFTASPRVRVYSSVLAEYKASSWGQYGTLEGNLEKYYPEEADSSDVANALMGSFFEDAACTEKFDFGTEILSGNITLYATDGTSLPTTEDPTNENPSTEQPSTLKEYKILDGADPTYTLGSRKNIVIRSEGPMSNYKSISFNDVKVPGMALTITEGSTIIDIDSLYLESLKAGQYSVYIEFADGYSKTTLTIVEASADKAAAAADAANEEKKGAVVKTGDVGTPIQIIAISLVALGGVLAVTVIRKKKNLE